MKWEVRRSEDGTDWTLFGNPRSEDVKAFIRKDCPILVAEFDAPTWAGAKAIMEMLTALHYLPEEEIV